MSLRLVIALAVGILLSTTSSALAQAITTGSSVFSITGGGRIVAQRNYALTVSGEVRIAFHGDLGAGCAVHGVCGYSGTAIWKPAASASATFIVIADGHARENDGFSDFNDYAGLEGEIVHRSVLGAAGAVCADASVPNDPLAITPRGTSLTVAPDVSIGGRCAGPLDADLVRSVPSVTVPASTFTRGRITLNLSGTRSFATHGLRGTVNSTITITGRKQKSDAPTVPPRGGRHRFRWVMQSIALVRGAGSMRALVAGAQDATVCALVDSCGAHGTITWDVTPRPTTGDIWASGPASLPMRAYRVALGLEPGRRDRRIFVFGGVGWDGGGPVHESIAQGGHVCNDSAPGGGGFVLLAITGGAVHAALTPGSDGRTRCPGPELDPGRAPPLTGTVGWSRTRHQFSVGLRGGGTMIDDGYTADLSGSASLTLRRGRITQRIETY